jgi:hypothetical protein
MTTERFEALEEAIEEIEFARIEQESGSQKARLRRARDIIDRFLQAYEEFPALEPIA